MAAGRSDVRAHEQSAPRALSRFSSSAAEVVAGAATIEAGSAAWTGRPWSSGRMSACIPGLLHSALATETRPCRRGGRRAVARWGQARPMGGHDTMSRAAASLVGGSSMARSRPPVVEGPTTRRHARRRATRSSPTPRRASRSPRPDEGSLPPTIRVHQDTLAQRVRPGSTDGSRSVSGSDGLPVGSPPCQATAAPVGKRSHHRCPHDASLASGRPAAQAEGPSSCCGRGTGLSLTKRTPASSRRRGRDRDRRGRSGQVQAAAAIWRRAGTGSTASFTPSASPPGCLGGDILRAEWEQVAVACISRRTREGPRRCSAALLSPREARRWWRSTSTRVAWPAYDWMGVAKAALESWRATWPVIRPRGVGSICGGGPVRTMGQVDPQLQGVRGHLGRSGPLGWDVNDSEPVARACVALLSDCSHDHGEMVHVDGGVHAVGA